MDAVVCTLVLCTIPDPQKALECFYQWLKPDGTLIVLEHIRSNSLWKAKIQDFVMPLWKALGEGCHINRKTDQMIKGARFEALKENYFTHTSSGIREYFTSGKAVIKDLLPLHPALL